MRRLKIITVCGCGLGTSLMAKMTIEDIIKTEGFDARVETADIGTAKGYKADLIITTEEFAKKLVVKTPIVVVSNFVNKVELREKLISAVKNISE